MNSYFEKFRNMKPYFSIDEKEWTYITETFSEEQIRKSLVKVLMEYEPPYMDISEKEFMEIALKHQISPWQYDDTLVSEGKKLHDQDQLDYTTIR